MRHNKSGRKLGRTWEHRKALFKNMATALLTHGRIRTTEAKAKELRKVADRLVTLSLRNDLHSRRLAFKVLNDHSLVKKLFDEIGPRFSGVQGGYTRIVKLSLPRRGDCAPMAYIELTRQPGEQAPEPAARKAAPAVETPKPATPAPEAAEAELAPEAQTEPAPEAQAEPAPEAQAEPAPEAQAEPAPEAQAEKPEAVEEPKKD
jgi:large subunit ribosomal protein L17